MGVLARQGREGPFRSWELWWQVVAGRLALGVGLAVALAAPSAGAAGDIQVVCEPGVRVFLDGRPMGVANLRDDGFFLIGVPSGERTLRLEKDGYLPQVFRLEVPDHPIEVRGGPFVPLPALSSATPPEDLSTDGLSGTVVITSAPQNCTVEFNGTVYSKRSPHLVVPGLPPGEHAISFAKEGYPTLQGVVAVRVGVTTAVRGNLIDGRVEVLHSGKGSLRLLTRPDGCEVRFLGRVAQTTRGRWNVSHIPAGEHRMVVSKQGRELTVDVLIAAGKRTVVAVSFFPAEEPVTVSYEPE